jgi:Bacterial regulatory protein, Fis family
VSALARLLAGALRLRGAACYTASMLAAHAWIGRLFDDYGPACLAQALGAWSCTRGRLDLVCGWRIDQRLYNLVHEQWPDLRRELRRASVARLASNVSALPVQPRRDRLTGLLLFAGELPGGAARELLTELQRRLLAPLSAPLPPASPEVLTLPLTRIDAPGGAQEVERAFLDAVVARHGGNVTRTAAALDMPRQTLHDRLQRLSISAGALRVPRALPSQRPLPEGALELERSACRLILERTRGDLKLGAVLLCLTTATWKAYVQGLGIDLPAPRRRPVHRRQR